MTSNREHFESLWRAVNYTGSALQVHENLPHDRAHDFAHQMKAKFGTDVWQFLMSKAEEMEQLLRDVRAETSTKGTTYEAFIIKLRERINKILGDE